MLSAHQIIDNRSEESQRQYGSIDTNCDDAATIASVIQNKVLTASDVEPILQEFSNSLTNKNVSAEIAQEICKQLKKELIGT